MSILKNTVSGKILVLRANHSVGRSHTNLLEIQEKDISKVHATIVWNNDGWQLKDHSRNGTLVNQKLIQHATVKLTEGSVIQFGTGPNTLWKLIDGNEPKNYLISDAPDTALIMLDEDYILYPDSDTPVVSFFKSRTLRWMIEDNENTQTLEHGVTYQFCDRAWTYHENEVMMDTYDLANIVRLARIDCHLSKDEESVELRIVVNDLEMTLGEKVYNFLLLLLARQRLEDIQNGLPVDEQGWLFIEPLLKALSKELLKEVDIYYFNVMIHRFRQHVRALKPYGHLFANVIERKRGKVRLNYSTIRIIKANEEIASS